MSHDLLCWQCGASLAGLSLPLQRLDQCPRCEAELHVCRMCVFFDSSVAGGCIEERAEDVKDKTRANFCDYFKPTATAYVVSGSGQDGAAREQLDALFGDAKPSADEPSPRGLSEGVRAGNAELDQLFKK